MSRIFAVAGAAALLALVSPGGAPARADGWSDRVAVLKPAGRTIVTWPARARRAARLTMERYGRPDEVENDALVWHGNGPWKRTTAHRRARTRRAFRTDADFIENTIRYDVPIRFLDDLERFHPGLAADPERGELSARSESEALNMLALNLADEIIKGARSVEDARALHARLLRFSDSGKSSPYLNRLLFAQSSQSFSFSFLGR